MKNNNFYLLTGAPGSGKSSVIQELRQREYVCVEEAARQTIAAQKAIDGEGIYEKNSKLFIELMYCKALDSFKQHHKSRFPVIFDRGIPDIAAYAKLSGDDYTSYHQAAIDCKYNNKVFSFPAWEEIYTNDEDRKMSFKDAKMFGDIIEQVYQALGYELIKIPFVEIDKRAEYIIDIINSNF